MTHCKNCDDEMTGHAKKLRNRSFCDVECSREWQSKNLTVDHGLTGIRTCSSCKTEKPLSEFNIKVGGRVKTYCKPCLYLYQMRRWNNNKVKAIEYLGGKCKGCGLVDHPVVYDFHHRDPSTKCDDWSKMRIKSWDKIMKELDKCDLLCCICHRKVTLNHELWQYPRQDSNLQSAH